MWLLCSEVLIRNTLRSSATQQPEASNLSRSSWDWFPQSKIALLTQHSCRSIVPSKGKTFVCLRIVLTAFKQILGLEEIPVMWAEVGEWGGFAAPDWRFWCVCSLARLNGCWVGVCCFSLHAFCSHTFGFHTGKQVLTQALGSFLFPCRWTQNTFSSLPYESFHRFRFNCLLINN